MIHHRGDFSGSFVTGGGTILIIAGILGVLIVAAGILGAIFLSRFWLAIVRDHACNGMEYIYSHNVM